MKKRMMTTALIFSLLFCVNAWAGKTLRQFMNQGGGSAPPHSKAFGVTSEALLKEYIIWFVETAPEPGHLKKVQFLPLPTEFDPNTGIGHVGHHRQGRNPAVFARGDLYRIC